MYYVLIVDDSDVDRLLMEGLLKKVPGFEVIGARDGVHALEQLKAWSIDMVITDIQMPRMDGLELIKAARKDYPDIPVVLTTGMGSEEIAAVALKSGAASYIPKSRLNKMLISTVEETFDMLSSERNYNRLLQRSMRSHFEFSLDNDPAQIPAFVDFTEKMLKGMTPLNRTDRLRVSMAVSQALNNALYRGNLEIGAHYKIPTPNSPGIEFDEIVTERLASAPWKDRKILVAMEIRRTGFGIRIRDDGPGFDTSNVGSWTNPTLRGVILMKSFMDEVIFSGNGNDVEMRLTFAPGENTKGPEDEEGSQKVSPNESRGTASAVATPATARKKSSAKVTGTLTCSRTRKLIPMNSVKFLIGRRPTCHLVCDSDSVASLHCLLLNDGGNWYVKNLCASNPAKVNGESFDYLELSTGDVLTIGDQEFVLHT